ncbi:MAG: DUF47 family protein [Hyphomicrobium sp.]|jgi:uncharacterized protein Yka (UPF0111/DUF47 family)|nr:DUF47 family protein [Hyphomicrobium sp.]
MTKSTRFAVGSLFGPSRSDRLVELLKELSRTAIECAALFRETKGRDARAIIAVEHKADRIVEQIHELLDNSFIMRFDIPDSMKLTDNLDDVVDGMRKVALHLEAYAPFVSELSADAMEVFALGEAMLHDIDTLVDMLAGPRLSLPKVREVTNRIDAAESMADKLVAEKERKLVAEYAAPGANAIGFIATHQLFHLLEQMTDDANHCANMVLSLARKEA